MKQWNLFRGGPFFRPFRGSGNGRQKGNVSYKEYTGSVFLHSLLTTRKQTNSQYQRFRVFGKSRLYFASTDHLADPALRKHIGV